MAEKGLAPNFLLAGVPKCGTSSLAALLAEHPQVFMSQDKELHYFDRNGDRGLDWYRSHFTGAGDAIAVGEATPTYVLADHWLDALQDAIGQPKLVLMFRHPVDRAYSHFNFNRWRDRRSFAQVVDEELQGQGHDFGYVRDGRYIEIVDRVLARFPPDRLHVVLLDDLRRDPLTTVKDAYRFLGVDDGYLPANEARVENPAFRFRSRRLLYAMMLFDLWNRAPRTAAWLDRRNRTTLKPEPMDPHVRRRLLDHYAEPNRRLADWLGRQLSEWKR